LTTNTSHLDTQTLVDHLEVQSQARLEAEVGVVYKKNIGSAVVHTNGRVILCSLSNRLRKQLIYAMSDGGSGHHSVRQVKELAHNDPIAVGDRVQFIATGAETGMIVEVLPRRSQMKRRSAVPMPGAHPFEQVIVANLDQVVPVFAAAQPAPKWGLLDRYLVSAESSGLPALICITKLDLANGRAGEVNGELLDAVETYRRIGYPVILTSTVTGEGLDELGAALNGRISAFLGKSGVGKTSLLNALQPGLGLRVNQVNQRTGKGKHTTTALEMFPLGEEDGVRAGAIVDTPGVREFGLWEVEGDDLAQHFPEMRPLVGCCRFGLDCRHDQEPGCAIRKAVTEGHISPYRYRSLQVLMEETA
jgi:ribosome biogenesis GTPase / thiamine phosphate phosphatase